MTLPLCRAVSRTEPFVFVETDHCWFVPLPQVYWITAAPFAVDLACTSRHLPLATFTMWKYLPETSANRNCWLAEFEQVASRAFAEFARLCPAICTHLLLATPAIVYVALGSTVSASEEISRLSPWGPEEQPKRASETPRMRSEARCRRDARL